MRLTDTDVRAYYDGVAREYAEQAGEEGDFYHRTFIIPTVLGLLGEVKDLRVLDMGCGTGTVSRRLARKGARVTGIDISEGMLEVAVEMERRESLGISYALCSASNLALFGEGGFDRVVCNMALMDIADFAGAIREAHRILTPGGKFAFSILHPCFCTPAAGWAKTDPNSKRNEDKLYWKVDHYFARRCGRGLMEYTPGLYFHRTLADYLNTLVGVGFILERVEEPEPQGPLAEQRADMTRMGEFLVVSAQKRH